MTFVLFVTWICGAKFTWWVWLFAFAYDAVDSPTEEEREALRQRIRDRER